MLRNAKTEIKHNNSDNNNPIYYNLTLNKGFNGLDNDEFNTPANFNEINNTPFLFNSGNWFIALMRCTIPTDIIPRYIFPIQDGINQTDINLSYNIFTFRYATAPNTYLDPATINDYQATAQFQSEILNPYPNSGAPNYLPSNNLYSYPKPPSANEGFQDVKGTYYFVYYVETLQKIFNDTLATLWQTYITAMNSLTPPVVLPPNIQPYFTYDNSSQLWSFNAESQYFSQSSYPRVELYIDPLTASNTLITTKFNVRPSTPNNKDTNLCVVNNLYNNNIARTINTNNYIFYQMTADQSGIVNLASFQKILFEISGDISLKNNESDSVPLNFQSSTSSLYQKPLVPMLVDIEVDRIQWANNTGFIQFQASSIEQVRLISLTQKASIQNFNMSISWLDNYGTRRPILLPNNGNPLTVKLAFFNKEFRNMD